jgi:predicted hydrocarbon binding protein
VAFEGEAGGRKMNRKEFLKTIGAVGLSAGAGALLAKPALGAGDSGDGSAQYYSCDEKTEFAEGYVTRLIDVIDNQLDLRERDRLLKANGKACFRSHLEASGREVRTKNLEEFVAALKKYGGEKAVRQYGNIVHFQVTKDPQGNDVPEGTCLCPMAANRPEGLSKTFCVCSIGYVQELFQTHLGRPVEVELLESALGGGKYCRFRVEVI